MSVRLKPLSNQIMVITGASSGIGLATAQAGAKAGLKVVLVARDGDALAKIERDIATAGGKSAHVVADVGNRADVQKVADFAVQKFGGFDTWVNNAGVSVFGKLEEVSDEDHRKIFETNFWGLVYGSLVAVKHLRQRGGSLINLGSVASDVAFPTQGMYCASKHAVKGFTDALRIELMEDKAPVTVTLIKPAAINTPFTKHAANYLDQEPKLPPPVYPVEDVAKAILHAATHGDRDIYVGGGGRLMSALDRQLPGAFDWIQSRTMSDQQKSGKPPQRDRAGTLHRPGLAAGMTRGDHPGIVMGPSLYTWAARNPALAGLLAVGAGIAATALARGGLDDGPEA